MTLDPLTIGMICGVVFLAADSLVLNVRQAAAKAFNRR